ncbi:MAG: alpha/beta hydrolase [Acidovorax sp.]|nr:alpha/beta hydrolase [Acidovorax sp.]
MPMIWFAPLQGRSARASAVAAAAAVAAMAALLVLPPRPALAQTKVPAAARIPTAAPPVQKLADVPYGPDRRQRMDVYLPAAPTMPSSGSPGGAAPVLLMVHGGAWSMGDKAHGRVVEEKVARWVARGWVVVSANYRLLPAADVLQQAQDVASALAAVQRNAAQWGGDAARVVLMGHSAGAHLASLVSTAPVYAQQAGVRPWLGTVALDSAALDVPALMQARHAAFYDGVFGADPAFWRAASPAHGLPDAPPGVTAPAQPAPAPVPFLLVCSTLLSDGSCRQSAAMTRRLQAHGGRAEVLPQPLSHGDINARLGLEGDYTRAVKAFLATLDPWLAAHLP